MDYDVINSDNEEDFVDEDLSTPNIQTQFDRIPEFHPSTGTHQTPENLPARLSNAKGRISTEIDTQSRAQGTRVVPPQSSSSPLASLPIMRVDANDTLPMMRATAPTPRFETLDTSCCEENVDAQIGTESSYILDNATVPLSPVVFRGGSDTSDMSDRLSDTDDGMSPDIYMEDSTDGLVSSDVHLNRAERDRLDAMFAAAAPSDTTIDEDAVTHTTNGVSRDARSTEESSIARTTSDSEWGGNLFSDIGATPLTRRRSMLSRSGSMSANHSRSNSGSGLGSVPILTIPPFNSTTASSSSANKADVGGPVAKSAPVTSPIRSSLPPTTTLPSASHPWSAAESKLIASSANDTAVPSILSDTSVLSDGEFTPCVSRQDSEAVHLLRGTGKGGRRHTLICGINRSVFTYICVLIVSAVGLGYDLGIITIAKDRAGADLGLDADEVQIMVGILNVASAFGGVCIGIIADMCGRRYALLLSGALQCGGAVIMAFSQSFETLCLGRAVTGLGVGGALLAGPLYTAEISPMEFRGALVSLTDVFINVGIALGYAVGYALIQLPLDTGWRWMLGMGAAPAMVVMACIVLMPESPRWLMDVGRIDDAEAILSTLCTAEECEMAIFAMQRERDLSRKSSWRTLCCPPREWRGMLFVGMFTAFFAQACGIEGAIVYVPQILLRSSDIADDNDVYLATIGIGVLKAVVAAVSATFVDRRLGRRPMLLMSGAGMCLGLIGGAVNTQFYQDFAAAIASISFFMCSFSIGYGPVGWVLVSEIFPMQIRGIAMGLATFINRITSGVVASTFLSLVDWLGSEGTLYMFAGICVVAFLFTFAFVPETKGKSLEDIEGLGLDMGDGLC